MIEEFWLVDFFYFQLKKIFFDFKFINIEYNGRKNWKDVNIYLGWKKLKWDGIIRAIEKMLKSKSCEFMSIE